MLLLLAYIDVAIADVAIAWTRNEFFPKLPFSPIQSYLGFCDDLNAQTCNDSMQRWGNDEEGRWSTPS